jgi:hypothetical protein
MSTPEPPEPTPEERDAPPERLREEDAQRYPGHDNPEGEPDGDGAREP